MATQVKICGLTCIEDALALSEMGADYLGFVFYPPSKRYIEPEKAGEIITELRRRKGAESPLCIGVVVDLTPAEMENIRQKAKLDGIQLSGDEPQETLDALSPLRIRGISLKTLNRLGQGQPDFYLCDTHAPDQKGGTGEAYDYEQLRPWISRYPIMIAGGLTPESVGEVVSSLRPFGVDVSSALESGPGRKDLKKTRQFIEAVRRAG